MQYPYECLTVRFRGLKFARTFQKRIWLKEASFKEIPILGEEMQKHRKYGKQSNTRRFQGLPGSSTRIVYFDLISLCVRKLS